MVDVIMTYLIPTDFLCWSISYPSVPRSIINNAADETANIFVPVYPTELCPIRWPLVLKSSLAILG